jgi:hypothetical protein
VIALAVYNVEKFDYSDTHGDWTMCPGGGTCVQIVNFLAFFVAGIDKGTGDVTGYLTREAGLLTSGGGTGLNNQSSFMSFIQLVR